MQLRHEKVSHEFTPICINNSVVVTQFPPPEFLRDILKVFSFPSSHNPRVLRYPNLLICSKGKSRFHTSLHRRPGKIISFFFPGSNQLLGCPPPPPPRITPFLFGSLSFNPQDKPFPKLTSTDYLTKRMDQMTDVFSCRQF